MLEEWTLSNFKSVAKPITLQLAPLTLLVGPNSSGKSTVLQSILMVAQTLTSTMAKRPLILNGEQVRLGFATDVLHEGREDSPLILGFLLKPRMPRSSVKEGRNSIRVTAHFGTTTAPVGSPPALELRKVDLSLGSTV